MDQKSLRHLLEQKLSTPSQFGWLTKLMGMSYEIQYKKGRENSVADALLRATHGELLQLTVSSISMELWDLIKSEWEQDPKLLELIDQIKQHPGKSGKYLKYKWSNGVLMRKAGW